MSNSNAQNGQQQNPHGRVGKQRKSGRGDRGEGIARVRVSQAARAAEETGRDVPPFRVCRGRVGRDHRGRTPAKLPLSRRKYPVAGEIH